MKIVWSPRAIEHLIALRAFITNDHPSAAQDISARILAAAERLLRYPDSGRPGRIPGTRELVVPQTPYILPYRVSRGNVEIIAVFHGRQRWPDLF